MHGIHQVGASVAIALFVVAAIVIIIVAVGVAARRDCEEGRVRHPVRVAQRHDSIIEHWLHPDCREYLEGITDR